MHSRPELQEVSPQQPGEKGAGRCHAAAPPASPPILGGRRSEFHLGRPSGGSVGEALSETARLVISKHSPQVPCVRRYLDMQNLSFPPDSCLQARSKRTFRGASLQSHALRSIQGETGFAVTSASSWCSQEPRHTHRLPPPGSAPLRLPSLSQPASCTDLPNSSFPFTFRPAN